MGEQSVVCPTMEYYSAIKRMNYCYTQQSGWVSRELGWVRKAHYTLYDNT